MNDNKPEIKADISDDILEAALASVERNQRHRTGQRASDDAGLELDLSDAGDVVAEVVAGDEGESVYEAEVVEATPGAAAEHIQKELLDARNELSLARDNLLRTAAEFDNYRKRMLKEREDARRRAREELLRDLVSVLDHLDQAEFSLVHQQKLDPEHPVLQGLRLVTRAAYDVFRKQGIEAIESVGKPFDPHVHEAVQQMYVPDATPGHVIAETRKGFLLDGNLVRPASVVVAAEAPANG